VPGLAGINVGDAQVTSVSCASAGNCSAGGSYTDSYGFTGQQAFVVSEVNGTWGTAQEVAANLNSVPLGSVYSVSCASAGNCSAGGYYNGSNGQQPFVVSQVNGTWGTAVEVPGLGALSANGPSWVTSVSCASVGNCSAGGYYKGSNGQQAFVVSQVNGTWGTAVEVPGSGALNVNGGAKITSVSCASPGNCSAGGYYTDSSYEQQAFVVSQVNGAWGTAMEAPGTPALNPFGSANILSVSCGSAGNCGAGGYYHDSSGNQQAFVTNQQ